MLPGDILRAYCAVAESVRDSEFFVRCAQRKQYLTREVIERWHIGKAPTLGLCKAAGLSEETLESVGLYVQREFGMAMFFRDCMLFPFFDNGKIVYLASRRLVDHDPKTGEPLSKSAKSLSMRAPDPDGTGGVLLETGFNVEALNSAESVLLVEGPLDAIACQERGHPAIAMIGKAPRPGLRERIRAKRKLTYLALDGTKDVTLEERLEIAARIGPGCWICDLPSGKDPDDLNAEDLLALKTSSRECVESWIDVFRTLPSDWKKDCSTAFRQHLKRWLESDPEQCEDLRARVSGALGLLGGEWGELIGDQRKSLPGAAGKVPAGLSVESKSFLDSIRERLAAIQPLSGTARGQATTGFLREMAQHLASASSVDREDAKKTVCDVLKMTRKALDSALREARSSLHAQGIEAGGDADWMDLARDYLSTMRGPDADQVQADLKRWREDFYFWDRQTGSYRQRSKEWIRGELARFITSRGVTMTCNAVSNVEEALRSLVYLDENMRPPMWVGKSAARNTAGVFVSLKNGILNIDKPDAGVLPHSPDFWTLCSLPYDFDLGATCPRFDAALAMWQPEEEPRLLMQAWAGYCFIPGNPEQVFMLNQGNGADGKSQWSVVLRALLGQRNVQGVGLEAFDPKNRFGLEPLLGAMLNVVGDANDIEKMGEGVLKAIVGGDPITIDRKHKTAITETLPCKFMMNCNQLPPFRDRTEGLWRRLILLVWDQTIPKEQRIKDFGEILVEQEIKGIFNWALCGYHRVRKEGFKFDPTGAIQRGIENARSTIQKEREFFEDCVGWDPDPKTIVSCSLPSLVAAYHDWCRDHNVKASMYGHNLGRCMLDWLRDCHPEQRDRFTKQGESAVKTRRTIVEHDQNTKRQWVYLGVYLRGGIPTMSS